jgi:hypothetical protein
LQTIKINKLYILLKFFYTSKKKEVKRIELIILVSATSIEVYTMNDGHFVIFREEQKSGQWWGQVIALLIAIFVWSRAIQGIAQGLYSGMFAYIKLLILLILAGVIFPYYMLSVKQVTEVRKNQLYIYTEPFKYGLQTFPLKEIKHYEVRKLSLLRDNRIGGTYVGGGGKVPGHVPGNISSNEFIAKGNDIVEVEFNNGKKIKIGTQRPDELARVLSNGTNYGHIDSKMESNHSQKQYLKLAYMIVVWIVCAAFFIFLLKS